MAWIWDRAAQEDLGAAVRSEAVPGARHQLAQRLRSAVLGPRGGGTTRRRASDAFRLGLAVVVVAVSIPVMKANSAAELSIVHTVHPPPAAISWLVTTVSWLGSAGVSVLLVIVGLLVPRLSAIRWTAVAAVLTWGVCILLGVLLGPAAGRPPVSELARVNAGYPVTQLAVTTSATCPGSPWPACLGTAAISPGGFMIVVTTPTGQIGSQVLSNIVDSTETIRVITRDPARLSRRVRERVEVMQGSDDDIDVVTAAFTGAACVFWLVPPNPHAGRPEDYYRDFAQPACEAIRSQGVRRVVGVSTLGQGYPGNAGLLSAALGMDELIQNTGVSYRALAMPYFMENLLVQTETIRNQGMFFLANAADRPLATVATADVAAVAARLLLDGSWSGQDSLPVAGPDTALTPAGMAQVISEVLGRTVGFQQVPAAEYRAAMLRNGVSEAWAQGMIDMARAQDDGIYGRNPRTPQPAAPTSFRQWCTDTLKPAVLT